MNLDGMVLRVYGYANHTIDSADSARIASLREFVLSRSPLCGVEAQQMEGISLSFISVEGRDYVEPVADFHYSTYVNRDGLERLASTIAHEKELLCRACVVLAEMPRVAGRD